MIETKESIAVYRPILNLGSDYFEAVTDAVAGDFRGVRVNDEPKFYILTPDEFCRAAISCPLFRKYDADEVARWIEAEIPPSAAEHLILSSQMSVTSRVVARSNGIDIVKDSLTIGLESRASVRDRRAVLSALAGKAVSGVVEGRSQGALLAHERRTQFSQNRLKKLRASLTSRIVIPGKLEVGGLVVEAG
jgi:hypothetical protein